MKLGKLLLLFAATALQATQTFLRVRPAFWSSWPERVACNRYYFEDPYDVCDRSWLHIAVLGGRSLDGNRIARYFLPFDKSTLLAGELGSQAVLAQRADVIASYFGVLTGAPEPAASPGQTVNLGNYTFQSKLYFDPSYSFGGVGMCYHYHLSKDLYKGWWFEVAAPFMSVTTSMNMKEKIITPGGAGGNNPVNPDAGIYSLTMTQALASSRMLYGKIAGSQTAVGIADIELKVGYTFVTSEKLYWVTYYGGQIPTGYLPTNTYMFEPIIGYDRHWGIFAGGMYGYKFWQGKSGAYMSAEIETVGKYFFPNNQERLFDPYSAEWGRYRWMYANRTTTQWTPGVNYMSQQVSVHPGTTRDLNLAFTYRKGGLSIEAGYHYFASEAETVHFDEQRAEAGVAAIWANNPSNPDTPLREYYVNNGITKNFAQINNYSGINNDSVQNPNSYTPLGTRQLDKRSAQTPAVVTHTNYVTFGYRFRGLATPTTVSLGGSVEYGKEVQCLDRVTVFLRSYLEF